MFCKHSWEILSETVIKSKLEHFKSLFGNVSATNPDEYELERKHIQIVTCKKCGNLKRFVETI